MPQLRLQRYLAQAGIASRRRAEELIAAGAVKVNGKVVTTPGVMVAERDRVEVEGKRALRVDPVYRILLKPRACLATLADAGDRTTLKRYVRDPEPGLAVVAPLDFPAEGVVLLTTDGELADAISKRGQKVPMTYHLKFQGAVGESDIERLLRGWRWEDVPVRPSAITSLATTGKNTWIEMVVPEIRPRALKAAGDLVRHSLLKISRVRLGRLSFEGLAMGGWRDLSKTELQDLRQSAGLSKGPGAEGAELTTAPIAKQKKSKQENPLRRRSHGK
ncbi:MAG TPA: S4 domain-containing protein [Polyangia bacterium]|nr:S4 domain-containing protein [Polyangia bacterium]